MLYREELAAAVAATCWAAGATSGAGRAAVAQPASSASSNKRHDITIVTRLAVIVQAEKATKFGAKIGMQALSAKELRVAEQLF
jgi:hypothetical protein